MIVGWRIVAAARARFAFSGDGSRRAGTRWTSEGILAVYLADSLALAALESLVRLPYAEVHPSYVAIRCEFPEELVWLIEDNHVPPDWRDSPPIGELREIGDGWATKLRTPVMSVPSAIIPQERNYILNPAHPHFGNIAVGEPAPFVFDIRLLNRYNPAP